MTTLNLVQEATARIRKNFHYFKINYLLSMTVVLLMTMVVYPKVRTHEDEPCLTRNAP